MTLLTVGDPLKSQETLLSRLLGLHPAHRVLQGAQETVSEVLVRWETLLSLLRATLHVILGTPHNLGNPRIPASCSTLCPPSKSVITVPFL